MEHLLGEKLQDTTDRSRYYVATSFATGFATYLAVIGSGSLGAFSATVFNNVAWIFASGAAGAICLRASHALPERERRAWRFIALGCFAWFAGQCVWSYFEILRGGLPRFPHWLQGLFILYPLIASFGLLRMPKPSGASGLTGKHLGNLGLVACSFSVALLTALLEPVAKSNLQTSAVLVMLVDCVALAGLLLTTLYLLWSYRWEKAYWPLALIAFGAGVHAIAYVTYAHMYLTSTISSKNPVNASWLIAFGAIACAAAERGWQETHREPPTAAQLQSRGRWLEAVMPALLILGTLVIDVACIDWLTGRVIALTAGMGIVFAVVLGAREVWIQKEEQRLLAELNDSRNRLLDANRELSDTEQHIRVLNADLEHRVTERTAELESAYRELESFSYAVAHDIKAPLRAINAFGSLLVEEHGKQLNRDALNYVERMRHGALHMAQLVDDLLAYARVERQELQCQLTNCAALIDNCLAEQQDEIVRLGAQVSVDALPMTLYVDVAALTQALRNLLENALKFSRHATPPRIEIGTRIFADRAQIFVADNGIGFDMQYHDRIFALFQRLHRADEYVGTGIGLAIARKAIERMSGKLWAQSAPGQGATFYIELPHNND